jgi:hypothetical protein
MDGSRTVRGAATLAVALLALGSSPEPARAVNVQMTATTTDGTPCAGVIGGIARCAMANLPANGQITVTFSLPANTTLNGYDFNVQWDPNELTLVSSAQLFPHTQPPNTIPFTLAPNPADPLNSGAVALSLLPFATNTLFRMTFTMASTVGLDCQPDITWTPNGNGFAPSSVVVSNPAGASLDVGRNAACSDGLDNDGDGKIDFDGGVCAGVPTPTFADQQCSSASGTSEAPPTGGCGLLGIEGLFVLPLLARRRAR